MRLKDEVEDFRARLKGSMVKPGGVTELTNIYQACVPRDFWEVRDKDVTHNREVWDSFVEPYRARLHAARLRGYGLFLEGDNGVGKTMFLSYILVQAIKAGYFAYYTTVLDMDFNLKRGMSDPEVMARMEEMLDVEFLALDELSKERFKEGDSWIRTQVERVLKRRHDNNLPTLVAANAGLEKIGEAYGGTVKSVLAGKYQHVLLDSGDMRELVGKRMREEMGYE